MVVGTDGNVAALPVKAPQAIGDSWVVTEGLKGGEKVIVEGLQKIKVGAPAKAVPFKPAGASAPAAATASAPTAPASAPKAESQQQAKSDAKQG
jgi:Membrane-fusion protein